MRQHDALFAPFGENHISSDATPLATRSFDSTVGEADIFPQEITRALLNLISNGFYAATKRKAEANGDNYEPTLAASTKNLGDRVEIRIRDNGTGIPPKVKDKLFNPFFTTKSAPHMSAFGSKADMPFCTANVCF